MRVFRIIFRTFRDSIKSVFRNFSLSIASISCISITLLLVAVALVFTKNVNNFTNELEKDLTIVVFMDRQATDEETNNTRTIIENYSNVESVEYLSKNDVKESMQKESDVFNSIMSKWTDDTNPLQNQFNIKVKDINEIKNTAKSIKNIEKVDTVKYGEKMVDQLVSVFNGIKKGTVAVVILLVVVTIFLISNTIKLTIYSRKNEIEIMRLVGTSNSTIKLPFIFEGCFLGILGSLLPMVVTIYGYIFAYNGLNGYLFSQIIKLVEPVNICLFTCLIVLLIGAIVGTIGSYNAVRKYLKI